ncbi:hypothetical protein [Phyllobacterium lublinensis]|uniref:hypothetical protein n=1 Tax=Phyllobacterium lublinensis TaxID=2875708 RepID=UPI001CCDE196|nr:hypothetical protein [Phyllobacterium sp. 2063]MBZ9656262.1 hypothetical protein [Phyllobacterium sp. 2063]
MSRINRRALLMKAAGSAAVIVSPLGATAYSAEARDKAHHQPRNLQGLIEAHKATYAAFAKAIYEKDSRTPGQDSASRAEERALLAVCAYPAVSKGDRQIKARYLLEVEARGELDLAEHIQTILRSTI